MPDESETLIRHRDAWDRVFEEVCDLPYYTEPEVFYERRLRKGMRIRELRQYASSLFEKTERELSVRDLKLAFLHKFPFPVSFTGNVHKVTVKRLNAGWILSCDCKAWVFNRNGNRTCRHTSHMEKIMEG